MANVKINPSASIRSGKHAGQSIQLFSQGTSLKNKNQPRTFRSINQDFYRNYLMQCVRQWRQLPIVEKENWIAWSAAFPQKTKSTAVTFLTGYQLFLKRNYYKYLMYPASFTYIVDPIFIIYPEDIPTISIRLDHGALFLYINFSLQSDKFDCIISCSNIQSSGKNYISTQFRELVACANHNQIIDISARYLSLFGKLPALNDTIFFNTIIFGSNNGQQVICPKFKSIVANAPIILNPWGYLYNWYALQDSKNISPPGFHAPTFAELNILFDYLGGPDVAGTELKLPSLDFWYSLEYASNTTAFSGIGAGVRQYPDGNFTAQKAYCNFWCLGNAYANLSAFATLQSADPSIVDWYAFTEKPQGFSLRYIKDSGATDTVTGNDGKVYPCISIGSQCWTAVNSSETKFRTGEYIPGFEDGYYHPLSNAEWISLTTPRISIAPWAI